MSEAKEPGEIPHFVRNRLRNLGSHSGIAALPRIVTLHDIEMKPVSAGSKDYDHLQLELTAKTYRYLDEEELAAADTGKRKVVRKQ